MQTTKQTKGIDNLLIDKFKYITICLVILVLDYIANIVYCAIIVPILLIFSILGLVIHVPLGFIACWRHSKWFMILFVVMSVICGLVHLFELILGSIVTSQAKSGIPSIPIAAIGTLVSFISCIIGINILRKKKFQVEWFYEYEMLEKE